MSRPVSREELAAWLHLRLLPGLADRRLRDLVARHGSARTVLELPEAVLGRAPAGARWLPTTLRRLELGLRELRRLQARALVIDRPRYPRRLLHLHDPPCLLLARGRLELLRRPAIAIVGSRGHTPYGAGAAEQIGRELAEAGLVVVSGLARGIDGIAHRAALAGGTIAVLGSGIDVPYPRENTRLYQAICEQGLVLSEFAPGTPPLPYNFPRRNRIIAALARAVVVVEASSDSGSLITVGHALDLGLDVFVVPGPIGRTTSAGTNKLIREGATLVTCAADILDELPVELPPRPAGPATGSPPETAPAGEDGPPLGPEATALLCELGAVPRHVDELAAGCALPPGRALVELLALELGGLARQLPGARFVRT